MLQAKRAIILLAEAAAAAEETIIEGDCEDIYANGDGTFA
jgi:hypothetical protein